MSKRPTHLQHFRSFAYQNNIKDFDKALEYFTVFGGTGWDVDGSKSLDKLIEEKVLCNYEPLHKSMTRYTHNNPVYHKLLSLVAQGLNHEHDAFKKALEDRSFKSMMKRMNIKVLYRDGETFKKLYKAEVEGLKKIADVSK